MHCFSLAKTSIDIYVSSNVYALELWTGSSQQLVICICVESLEWIVCQLNVHTNDGVLLLQGALPDFRAEKEMKYERYKINLERGKRELNLLKRDDRERRGECTILENMTMREQRDAILMEENVTSPYPHFWHSTSYLYFFSPRKKMTNQLCHRPSMFSVLWHIYRFN